MKFLVHGPTINTKQLCSLDEAVEHILQLQKQVYRAHHLFGVLEARPECYLGDLLHQSADQIRMVLTTSPKKHLQFGFVHVAKLTHLTEKVSTARPAQMLELNR